MLWQGTHFTLLGAGGPAVESRMHKAAWLWLFKDFKHRRLVSYGYHGVRMNDKLEMDTTLAPNLHSVYDVQGGPDAIADEMAQLKSRGWLWHIHGRGRSNVEPPATAASSPGRYAPRGAAARKDNGPPRGVAEDGYPRQQELTRDAGTEVDSVNNSSGARVGLGGPDLEVFPLDEIKPRVADACIATCILWCFRQMLAQAIFYLVFNHKYFYHALVYEMAEVWKRGFAVPAQRAEGGAHETALDVMLELVMAMGWTIGRA